MLERQICRYMRGLTCSMYMHVGNNVYFCPLLSLLNPNDHQLHSDPNSLHVPLSASAAVLDFSLYFAEKARADMQSDKRRERNKKQKSASNGPRDHVAEGWRPEALLIPFSEPQSKLSAFTRLCVSRAEGSGRVHHFPRRWLVDHRSMKEM